VGFTISLNDVCVFVPAIFGPLTCLFSYGITKEVSGSANAAVVAAAVLSINPAHLMRSVAGGYDNESVALCAIVSTFYLWLRSLRTPQSWPYAFLCALSYIYMVSSWGAYPFVLNMIGLHAAVLVLVGRFSNHLHLAYSIFYVLGTIGALQFPVVGWQPLESMEQLGPMAVFFGLQVFRFLEVSRVKMDRSEFATYRAKILALAILVGAIALGWLLANGRLGALSTRVRSLFIQHTKTGNPLVDSVAEHQATPPQFYFQYFHLLSYVSPIGFVLLLFNLNDAKYFAICYCVTSYYFSQKMVRLVLLLSPAACITAGIALWVLAEWSVGELLGQKSTVSNDPEPKTKVVKKEQAPASQDTKSTVEPSILTAGKPNKKKPVKPKIASGSRPSLSISAVGTQVFDQIPKVPAPLRKVFAALFLISLVPGLYFYTLHSFTMAKHVSQPQIILQGQSRDGRTIMIDDFRESYWWLRDNTPANARIMAWWDYGYQINGVANRTTIADGNTWNHEHIALLGKALVSTEEESHLIVRHLADYVLVWTTRFAGMWGDDLAKMPHMANIAGSVYPEVDRTGYYMDQNGQPSPLMRGSLLYLLSTNRLVPETPPVKNFKEVYTSKHNMVRIYQVLNVAKRTPFGKYSPRLKIGQFRPH
jgi:dolichyl-diphosphooligosaccharide--protein glycosyltransferase